MEWIAVRGKTYFNANFGLAILSVAGFAAICGFTFRNVLKWCPLVGGSKMSPRNRTLGGGWGGQKWPRKIGHHLRTFSLCSAKLGICTIVCLVGGECTYYIHNKYRQRIVFCWWDCIQSTPLMMRYLKHFYIWDFVIHLRKSQIQKKLILFLIKN